MKSLLPLALLLALTLVSSPLRASAAEAGTFEAGRAALERVKALRGDDVARARSVVLFVGDGMSLSTVTAARILQGQQRGETGEENQLAFERFPSVALSRTWTTDRQVPDSAGTMTAMVTGAKTRSGVVSVAASVPRGDAAAARANPLETLLEGAETRGLATGVVTTTTVTHATPAAGYAHSPDRGWEVDAKVPAKFRGEYPDIARQLVEFRGGGDGLEVALGGGRAFFLPAGAPDPELPDEAPRAGRRLDGRDLTAEWVARPGSRYVWSREEFLALDVGTTERLLGLFEPSHMQFESDRARDPGGEPSLAEMTERALAIVGRDPDGFVLIVEGGRIDHAHHFSNAYRALHDTIALSDAVEVALRDTRSDETLIIVTADHGHVFTISGYPVRGNPILGKVRGTLDSEKLARDAEGRPFTTLGYHNGPGHRSPIPDLTDVDTEDSSYQQQAAIPLMVETHSGEDVPVYATGPGSELLRGVIEQNVIYHAAVEALGWNAPAKPRSWIRRLLFR